MSKKYEEFFKLQRTALSSVKKLSRTISRQNEIRDMLKIRTTESVERDFAVNMEFRLSSILSTDGNISSKVNQMKAFIADFKSEVGQFVQWPPQRQNEEFAANFLVNLLDDEQFQATINSAVKGGFVMSDSQFFYKTVRDFLNKNLNNRFATDVEGFISLINQKIDMRNKTNDNNTKIRKINKVWLRSKFIL